MAQPRFSSMGPCVLQPLSLLVSFELLVAVEVLTRCYISILQKTVRWTPVELLVTVKRDFEPLALATSSTPVISLMAVESFHAGVVRKWLMACLTCFSPIHVITSQAPSCDWTAKTIFLSVPSCDDLKCTAGQVSMLRVTPGSLRFRTM